MNGIGRSPEASSAFSGSLSLIIPLPAAVVDIRRSSGASFAFSDSLSLIVPNSEEDVEIATENDRKFRQAEKNSWGSAYCVSLSCLYKVSR